MGAKPGRFLGAYLLLASGWWLAPMLSPALVRGQEQAYAQLRGKWQTVELVDDGRVIPQDAIDTWMPTGGKVEVIDNTFVFTSSADGQRHARTFEVDATRYPHEINFRVDGRPHAHGIYQFDQGNLVICAAAVTEAARPADFSAPKASRRVLLVLKRSGDAARPGGGQSPAVTKEAPPLVTVDSSKLPPPPDLRSPPGNTGQILTDAEVQRMLLGTWKYNDRYGDFFLTLDGNGVYNTYRETLTTSAFQQVFVRVPVSSGTWILNNGQVTFRCAASVQRERVNQQVPLSVRSISESDLIFMDLQGQIGKAVKVR